MRLPKFDGFLDAMAYKRQMDCLSMYSPTMEGRQSVSGNEPPPPGEALSMRRYRPWLEGLTKNERKAQADRIRTIIFKLAGATHHSMIELWSLPKPIYDPKGNEHDFSIKVLREAAAHHIARELLSFDLLAAYPKKVAVLPPMYIVDIVRLYAGARPTCRFVIWANSLGYNQKTGKPGISSWRESKGRSYIIGILDEMHEDALEISSKALKRSGLSA